MQINKPRLTSLDGIRGLAMLLVFLNHVDGSFIVTLLPAWLQILSPTFFSSGVLGVSFLFILTGFLMAYIYPSPSKKLHFLQKRYTRIFPLFLTLSVVMLILRNISQKYYLLTIPLILVFAFLTHFIWVNIIKKIDKRSLSRKIFLSFLILQVIIGFIYTFVIIKFPPIVFNQELPTIIREGLVGLVNMTLTLPLGNYIPMLDGVYWSLTSEILFYVLYPVVCVPFIIYLSSKKRSIKLLFLFSLFPLFAGADILSHKILVISMLQISLFSYFVVGMTLGYLYKKKNDFFNKLNIFSNTPLKYWTLIFLIVVIILPHFLQQIIPSEFHPLINLFWALPFGLVIALAINPETFLAKFLSSRLLIFIGLISYSIYLSHTAILHMMQTIFKPWNILTSSIFILFTLIITIAISSILYYLVEKPYFIKTKEKNVQPIQKILISKKSISLIIFSISVLYILTIFSAYQSDFNFLSTQDSYSSNIITYPKTKNTKLSMYKYPKIAMKLKANENKLGVITMHISHQRLEGIKGDYNEKLIFKIKEDGTSNWYSVTSYDLYRIKESLHHPFGFPTIQASKNKIYDIELSLSRPLSPDYIVLDVENNSIKAVYPVDKLELIKNPLSLIRFTENKVLNVLYNNEARYTFILFIPFVLISIYSLI